jgi:hypothetical protein
MKGAMVYSDLLLRKARPTGLYLRMKDALAAASHRNYGLENEYFASCMTAKCGLGSRGLVKCKNVFHSKHLLKGRARR